MSPKPDDGALVIEEPQPRTARVTKGVPTGPIAPVATPDEFGAFTHVETAPIQKVLPVFRARVVYLGGNPHHSITLAGLVYIERHQRGPDDWIEKKTPKESDGTQVYDFSSHDNFGRMIESRLWPATSGDSMLRNRPWLEVEHPEHLRWFLRKRNANNELEYAVLPHRDHKAAFSEYVMAQQRKEDTQEQFVEEIRTNM